MVAGAIAAALKKKKLKAPEEKTDGTFYTPARYGWGQVARDLHPQLARVSASNSNKMNYWYIFINT